MSPGFLQILLNNGCRFLSLSKARIFEGHIFDNFLNKPTKLRYLNLSDLPGYFSSRTSTKLLEFCFSLEKLSLQKLHLTSPLVDSICFQNGKSLKVLDLSSCSLGNNPEESRNRLDLIVKNCVELKELNLSDTRLSENSLAFLATNLTPKVS